ncbi:MAG TPA: RnfABCDGE type electron transport complex subunit D [Armatimonadetes bacterium]|nr:RnfABCDGE type electron transport complex subunit D [Armatimonadota bacterium]
MTEEGKGLRLAVSSSPHIREPESVARAMWTVAGALLIPGAFGIYFFGVKALLVIVVSVLSAVATEAFILGLMRGRRWNEALDGSAVITGLLLAYVIPPNVPLWMPAVGSFVAIAVAKQAFGGLGRNIFNPALVGRAFLMGSWPLFMTTGWIKPAMGFLSGSAAVDAVTEATPLTALKNSLRALHDPAVPLAAKRQALLVISQLSKPEVYKALFFGNVGGCIGETSAVAILLGAAILLWKRYIDWRVPLTYILTVALFSWVFCGPKPFGGDPIFHILSGGLFLGAFFMATDWVTTPITPLGRVIFAVGAGFIVVVVRAWGGYPEGVCYSILIMNAVTPLIDRYVRPRKFGERRGERR